MRLSILILTHNRPELFKRCIESVLKNKPDDVEILVNNDSNDIKEIPGADYYYINNYDLSKTYEFLFNKAQGKFIYFLEDDDYVNDDFYNLSNVNNNTLFRYIPFTGIKNYFDFWKQGFEYNFQLSQMIFKKKDLKEFPTGNNLQNDLVIFNRVNSINKFEISKKNLYIQTTDGNDNISYYKTNNDERFQIDEKYR